MEEILPPLQEEDKIIAGLCYPLWFLISWMVLISGKKNEPFVKFHAIQSLFLGGITTVGTLVLLFLLYLFFRIAPSSSLLGMGLFVIIVIIGVSVLFLAITALIFYYAFKALNGEFFQIIFIGKLTERFFPEYQERVDEFVS